VTTDKIADGAVTSDKVDSTIATTDDLVGFAGGAPVYADTSAGLAATSEGEYFNVPSDVEGELLILYRHDAGPVATELGRSASASGVSNAIDVTENADRIVTSANLFDVGKATDGKRVNTSDGTLYNGASYTVSDYIPVDASTSYTWAHSSQYAVYDSSKNFIEGGAANNLTTGASGAFVRYDMLTSNVGTSMFAKTSEYPLSYEPYETGVDFSDLVYNPDEIEAVVFDGDSVMRSGLYVEKRSLPFMVRTSSNLYDKNAAGVIDGYRLLETNAIVESATNSISDYIPAEEGESYAVTEGSYTHFYDSNKAYILGS
jgi:hypothetical protein